MNKREMSVPALEYYATASTSLININTLSAPYVVVYLSSVSFPGLLVTVRDTTGSSNITLSNSSIVVSTLTGVSFVNPADNGIAITQPFGYLTLGSLNASNWNVQNTFGFPASNASASYSNIFAQNGYFSNLSVSSIGINCNAPAFELDVRGKANISTQLTVGGIQGTRFWLAGGFNNPTQLAISRDGINWTQIASPYATVGIRGIAYNGNLWVAVGNPTNSIAFSRNGFNWTGLGTTIFSTYGRDVIWNGRLWVAGGIGTNTLAYSYDGISWVALGTSIFSSECSGIGWNGTLFVAGGVGATNSLAYSYDGITWIGLGKTIFSTSATNPTWNGTLWVVGGSGTNTLAYSYDGINWIGLGTSIFSTGGRYTGTNGQIFVATGQGTNTLAWSINGIQWYGLGSSIFTTRGSRVAWNGSIWVAAGQGTNTLAYSTDGINWTASGVVFNSEGQGLVWAGYNGNSTMQVFGQLAADTISTTGPVSIQGDLAVGTYAYVSTALSTVGRGELSTVVQPALYVNAVNREIDVNGNLYVDGETQFRGSVSSLSNLVVGRNFSTLLNAGIFGNLSVDGTTTLKGMVSTQSNVFVRGHLSTLSNIGVAGDVSILGNLNVRSNTTLQGNLTVLGTTNIGTATFTSASTLTISSGFGTFTNLIVNGATVLGGMVSTLSNMYVGGNLSTLSNTGIFGNLSVDGTTTLKGMVSTLSNMYVQGNFSTLSNVGIVRNLSVDGTTTLKGMVSTLSNVYIQGHLSTLSNAGIFGNLNVDGAAVVKGAISTFSNLNVGGALNVRSNVSVLGDLVVLGNVFAQINQASSLQVLASSIGVNCNAPAFQLDVRGTANISTGLTVGGYSASRLWVGVGTGGNSIAVSRDGINWTGRGTPVFTTGNGIAWNGSLWVAVGATTNSIAFSRDGFTWVGLGTGIFSTSGADIAWNGRIWVAVGQGTNSIAYSLDGITWVGLGTSIFSTTGNRVAWNGNLWVAVGNGTNTLAYSLDGIRWIGLGTSIFSTTGFGVVWGANIWVAVGQGTNTLAYSFDGISWVGLGTTIFAASGNGRSVAWNGSLFVAGGTLGSGANTMAYSYNGINWIGIGTPVFTNQCTAITWSAGLWIVGGFGTNTLGYSLDGINWVAQGTSLFTGSGRGFTWAGFSAASTTQIFGQLAADTISTTGPVSIQGNLTVGTYAYVSTALSTAGSGGLSTIINSALFVNALNSQVGVNLNAPTRTLDVGGTGQFRGDLTAASTLFASSILLTSGLGQKISLWGSNSNAYYGFAIQANELRATTDSASSRHSWGWTSNNGTFTEWMRLSNATSAGAGGTLSLNCNAPDTRFHLFMNGGIYTSSISFPFVGSPSTSNSLIAQAPSPSTLSWQWGDGTGYYYYFRGAASRTTNLMALRDDGRIGINCNVPAYTLDVNATARINSNLLVTQNVGIGTTSPSYPLDVNGIGSISSLRVGAAASADSSTNAANEIRFYGTNGDAIGTYSRTVIAERIYQNGTEFSELLFFKGDDITGASGPDRIRFLTTGNYRFDFTTAANGAWLSNSPPPSSIGTALQINPTDAGASNFRVGVNCNNPQTTLDVNGTIRANETNQGSVILGPGTSGNVGQQTMLIQYATDGNAYIRNVSTNGSLYLGTRDSNHFYINSAGTTYFLNTVVSDVGTRCNVQTMYINSYCNGGPLQSYYIIYNGSSNAGGILQSTLQMFAYSALNQTINEVFRIQPTGAMLIPNLTATTFSKLTSNDFVKAGAFVAVRGTGNTNSNPFWFSSTIRSFGSAVTDTGSSVNGSFFTMQSAGWYSIVWNLWSSNANQYFALIKNHTAGTPVNIGPYLSNVNENLLTLEFAGATGQQVASGTFYFNQSDTVVAYSQSVLDADADARYQSIRITRIATT